MGKDRVEAGRRGRTGSVARGRGKRREQRIGALDQAQHGGSPLGLLEIEAYALTPSRQQIEGRPDIGRQRREQDRRAIEAGAGADGGTEPLLGFRKLDGVEGRGPFRKQVQHQCLGAEAVGRIGRDAGVEFNRNSGDRHDGAAGVNHLDSVRQPSPFDVWEIERRRAADRDGRAREPAPSAARAGLPRPTALRSELRPVPAPVSEARWKFLLLKTAW